MPRLTTFHPFEFLRRLGVRDAGETELEMLDSAQPTIEVLNAQALFPPVLAPTAWFGARRLAIALEAANLQITAGPRGAFIREINYAVLAATQCAWRVTTTPTAPLNNQVALNVSNLSERGNVLSTVRIGTTVGLLGDGEPQARFFSSTNEKFTDIAYLAPGRTFEMACRTINVTAIISVLVQDAFGPEPVA